MDLIGYQMTWMEWNLDWIDELCFAQLRYEVDFCCASLRIINFLRIIFIKK
jgi:hypothetical protein